MALPPRQKQHGLLSNYLAQRPTIPLPANAVPFSHEEAAIGPNAPTVEDSTAKLTSGTTSSKKPSIMRFLALALVLALAIGLYVLWSPASSATTTPSITQQNFGPSAGATDTANHNTTDGSSIQVYIVGAVKHPGVYILPINARVYQLLQAAGGPLPNANLVSLNLAARLNDGQEVYVTMQGEKPPTYVGGVPAPGTNSSTNSSGNTDSLVNINTASAQEMQQKLHISSTTSAEIITYRTQHGPFTSVEQLAAVISKTTYDKIKGQVTV